MCASNGPVAIRLVTFEPTTGVRRATLALGLLALAACTVESADRYRFPADSTTALAVALATRDTIFPPGPIGASIRRGRALLTATHDSLPLNVGNALRCTSCHLDAGRRLHAMPWIGVYARFPQYRSRNDRVNVLEDRINDCFERSLNGKGLAFDSREMRDIVAYMAFLSTGIAPPGKIAGQGIDSLPPMTGDTTRGRLVFESTCSRCHGVAGDGTPIAPPLWGNRSYTIGAGMARVRTTAAFVRRAMPFDKPGTLTNAQAFDVAAYIDSRPRPDFAAKANDWPKGNPPPDVAYPTRAATRAPTKSSTP